jgi:ADP-heptose:LPS heptosyltransferase
LRKKDRDFLRTHPEIKFLGEEIKSFNDSASIIQEMDLVITVDTSLAHLSGALGKSTLILLPWNPEWRWLLDRQDSPWYPTAKIFRQPHSGRWESVIEDIALQLNLNHPC